jgi:hypothetical protein
LSCGGAVKTRAGRVGGPRPSSAAAAEDGTDVQIVRGASGSANKRSVSALVIAESMRSGCRRDVY